MSLDEFGCVKGRGDPLRSTEFGSIFRLLSPGFASLVQVGGGG